MLQARKKEAIKWRVLSVNGNDAFLIADCNLDSQPYNTTKTDVTWETSTIRSWLNGYKASYNANGINYSSNNFIGKAFTSAEQKAINQVTVVNHDNPEYETEGGNDTKDKVFLLSIEEATVTISGVTYKVTAISTKAFNGYKKLKTVTIGSNVKKIGSKAFYGCTALTKVTIGKNVTSIGSKAFCKCKKLKSINIPSKVKTIGSYAFYGCTSLTKATIGKNVTSIGSKAFCKCTKLANVTIPAKVKTIGNNAFYGCKKLSKVTMTAGKLKSVGKGAFKGVSKKMTITLKGTKKAKTTLKKKLKNSSVGYVKTWKFK